MLTVVSKKGRLGVNEKGLKRNRRDKIKNRVLDWTVVEGRMLDWLNLISHQNVMIAYRNTNRANACPHNKLHLPVTNGLLARE
jgi:hypothetical protein